MPLLRRRKLDRVTKDAFWLVVTELLVDLYGLSVHDAQDRTTERRAEVDLAPPLIRSDVFYHREPFDVASDLAQIQYRLRGSMVPSVALDNPQTKSAYEQILTRHGLA